MATMASRTVESLTTTGTDSHTALPIMKSEEDMRQHLRSGGSETEQIVYPTGGTLAMIQIAVNLAVFLMALDQSIIATAIPRITDEFDSLGDVGWYGSAYLLTTAALQLPFGKFYTFLDIKWTFLTAIGIFELGSLLCGAARDSTMLIVGRAIAGCGSAGIYSGGLLILANSVPVQRRAAYMGLIGATYGVSSVAGPLLGGAFTDRATWRWCFYINLPIGAVAGAIITFFFPQPKQHRPPPEPLLQRINRFDPIGTALFMPAIICLLLALQWGGALYAWNSGRIVALLVLTGLLLLAFVGVQIWKQENATVPPRIIKKRTVWASVFAGFTIGTSFFMAVYYLPLWFQTVEGASPVDSGIRILPMMLSVVLLNMVAGILVTVIGHIPPFLILGTILMAVGGGLFTTWVPFVGTNVWIGYQVIFGIGVGMAMQQPVVAVQTVLDIEDVAVGASLIIFAQTIGGAIFVSVGQTVLQNQLVQELLVRAPSLQPADVLAAGATGLGSVFPADVLPAIALSYNAALTKVFLVGAIMGAITILPSVCVEWGTLKGKKDAVMPAA